MRQILLLLAFSAFSFILSAQDQKVLSVDDFADWNKIASPKLSNNGQWAVYRIQPNHGDPVLVVYDTQNQTERRYERGLDAQFTADSEHLVFRLKPAMDTVRMLKLQDTKKDDLPTDTLAILNLASGDLERIPDLKNFKVPQKWDGWIAYGMKTTLADSLTKGVDKKAYRLVIASTGDEDDMIAEAVTSYVLAEEAPGVLFASDGLDSLDTSEPGIWYFNGQELSHPLAAEGEYEQLSLSRTAQAAAWVADRDTTEAEIRPYELFVWPTVNPSASASVMPHADWMPADWRLSEHHKLQFSHNEERLYFGVAPTPMLPDTNLLDEERVQVEVWTTEDPLLYTRQENRAAQEKKRTYTCLYRLSDQQIMPIATSLAKETRLADRGDGSYALTYNETPYLKQTTWEGGPSAKDLYLTDLNNGTSRPIAKAVKASPGWSPKGNYLIWYSRPDTAWYTFPVNQETAIEIANTSTSAFYDELNDRPMDPWPYGTAGWSADDQAIFLYDRYDIWQVDPLGKAAPVRLTEGRESNRRFRYIRLDREERHLPADRWLLHFFDEESCQEGYAWYDVANQSLRIAEQGDYRYNSRVTKAKEAEAYMYTRENFQEFPNLRFTRGIGTRAITSTISDANPQQSSYRWGSIEHFHWTSTDGQPLRGLLVKPDNFDPTKEYPLIVNFYERSSDGLHRHRTPEAHRSTINYAHYVSKGYIIFNPDVPYRVGYPGESAYNAVLSGVTALLSEGYIDRDRIGVQGHSWGGYQIAHLLTKTDIFRCAESGAPVVNMFSAYGGIRWGSGLSRQFQYEHTQSRIGGTPWEYPVRYMENSPLFFMDKVNTPVLILHNDEDGAVPWYQGIEYFVALRRLGKPAWFLNYNGEPHWPLKWPNRLDFQRRMGQYFDHFLLDAPLPRWMQDGVPATLKGIDQRYEAVDEKE